QRLLGDTNFGAEVEPRLVRVRGRMKYRLAASVVSALRSFDENLAVGRDLAGSTFEFRSAGHDAIGANRNRVCGEPIFLARAVLDDFERLIARAHRSVFLGACIAAMPTFSISIVTT